MTLAPRPPDATLPVAKAAHFLGVHPNTIRAWSDQGRLRFYRINARGDRRYRLDDLEQFLAEVEKGPEPSHGRRNLGGAPVSSTARSIGATAVELRTRPTVRGPAGPMTTVRPIVASRPVHDAPERTRLDIAILAHLADLVAGDAEPDVVMRAAVDLLRDRAGHDLVAILERRDGRLLARAARGVGADRLGSLTESAGLPARALRGEGPVAETAQTDTDWLGGSGSSSEVASRPRSAAAATAPGGSCWWRTRAARRRRSGRCSSPPWRARWALPSTPGVSARSRRRSSTGLRRSAGSRSTSAASWTSTRSSPTSWTTPASSSRPSGQPSPSAEPTAWWRRKRVAGSRRAISPPCGTFRRDHCPPRRWRSSDRSSRCAIAMTRGRGPCGQR